MTEIERKYDIILTHLRLIELSAIICRQIIFLTEKSYYFLGRKSDKPPFIVFQTINGYYTLISPKPFLNFVATTQKDIMDIHTAEIPSFLESLSKDTKKFEIYPCGYLTKRLSPAQMKRPCYLNELFAIGEALKYFDKETRFTKTIVISDSKPSIDLIKSKKFNSSSMPILLDLANNYQHVSFAYLRGELNVSDILSRPDDVDKTGTSKIITLPKFESKNVEMYESMDHMLSTLVTESDVVTKNSVNSISKCYEQKENYYRSKLSIDEFILETARNPPVKVSHYQLIDGQYFHLFNKKRYLPPNLEFILISWTHNEFGHCGKEKIINSILLKYSVHSRLKLDEKISQYIERCAVCVLCTPNRKAYIQGAIWQDVELVYGNYLSVDIMMFQMETKSSLTAKSNQALIICEHSSKILSGYLMANGTENEVLRALLNFFSINPLPYKILSDNGKPFKSVGTLKVLGAMGITTVQSSPYLSRARGNIERGIGLLRDQLRRLCLEFPDLSPQILLSLALPLHNRTPFKNKIVTPNDIRQLCTFKQFPFLQNHRIADENCKNTRHRINNYIGEVRKLEIQAKKKGFSKV